jgi:hypothetical protein
MQKVKFKIYFSHKALILLFLVFCIGCANAAETQQQISYWGIIVDDAGGQGVAIPGLKDDSPAGVAGLNTGDILLSVNGVTVRSAQEFRAMKNTFPLYTPLNLAINRKGVLIKRQIVLSGIVPLEVKAIKSWFIIPGVPLPPTFPAATISAIDAMDLVNVLDQVILDPGSGEIAIIGHYDNRFNTGTIPYMDILKTAMAYPKPKLDLEDNAWNNPEFKRAKEKLWNWPTKEFILGHPDLELERQHLIEYWSSACGLSPKELVSLFNYVNFSKKEIVPPPEIRSIQYKAMKYLGFVETAHAFDIVNQTGADAPLKALQLLGRDAEAQSILARSGGDAAKARGAMVASAYLAILEKIYVSDATVMSLRDGLTQGRITWQEAVVKAQGQMMPTRLKADKRDIVMAALNKIILSTKASRALLRQPLNDRLTAILPTDLDRNSQLTRIMYEADYTLKSLLVMPQLFRHIAGSMSNQEYEIYKGKTSGQMVTNHWLEPKLVDINVSPGRRVVSFGPAQMQYIARLASDDGKHTVINDPALNHYYDKWTDGVMNNYDEYARILPAFHKVREAAKVIALANWLITEKIPVDLSGIAQEKWDTPDKVTGFWRVGLVYVQKGNEPDDHKDANKIHFAYTGGVTFKRSNWTQITPSTTSETGLTNQLALSAGLGQKALQAAQSGNLEQARHLSELSAQAMSGSLSKANLAKMNITVPDARPMPVSPASVQLQKEMIKDTHQQILALNKNPSSKQKTVFTLAQLSNIYDQMREKPAAASDYLLQLQSGKLQNPADGGMQSIDDKRVASAETRLEQDEFENMNADWIKKQNQLIEQRLMKPNKYAAAIYNSLKTIAPPLPWKTFNELQPGDVLLINGKLIAGVDNTFSSENSSNASHTVIYLKEINGKKFFLDNQPLEGPRIISEDEFLKRYSPRGTEVARLAQPLNEKEGKKLFSAAVELAQKNNKKLVNEDTWFDKYLSTDTNYGAWGKDNVVCSESDWALINNVGRNIPKSGDWLKVKLGVDFSPADYKNSPYFLVTPLW